jgi:hypothetical protein
MSTPRFDHTATLLQSGNVLVAGGLTGPCGVTGTAEVYDPTTNGWQSIAPMLKPRAGHRAVRLADGSVLIVGGYSRVPQGSGCADADVTTTEIYSPATNTWTSVPSPVCNVVDVALSLLPSGQALASMPWGAAAYDPQLGSWTHWPNLQPLQWTAGGVPYGAGDALFVGANLTAGGDSLASMTFQFSTKTWLAVPPPVLGEQFYEGVLAALDDGRVLWMGGHCGPGCVVIHLPNGAKQQGCSYNCSALFNPTTKSWAQTGLASLQFDPGIVALPGAMALATGGGAAAGGTAQIFEASNGTWHMAPSMKWSRSDHTLTRLPSGAVLAAGGFDGALVALSTAEVYLPGGP